MTTVIMVGTEEITPGLGVDVQDVNTAMLQGNAYVWGRQDAGDRACSDSVMFGFAWAKVVAMGGSRPDIRQYFDRWVEGDYAEYLQEKHANSH